MIDNAGVLRIAAVLLIIMGGLIAYLLLTDREQPIDFGDVVYDDVEDAVQIAELAFYRNAPNLYHDDESEEAL